MLNSKIKLLKKLGGTQKCYVEQNTPGYAISQNSAKMGVPLQVYTLNHVLSVASGSKQYIVFNVQYKTEKDMPIKLPNTKI